MIRTATIAISMMAWMVGAGSAQVSQLNTGQQLDSNYQVGSGGYNTVIGGFGGVNTQFNSQLYVSGQVTGLANFHGRVGYYAPNQLNLVLPSAAIDNFRQQSVGVTQAVHGQTFVTHPYYTSSKTVLGAEAAAEGRTLPGTNMPINSLAQPMILKTYDELLKDYKPLIPQGSGVPMVGSAVPPLGVDREPSPLSTLQQPMGTLGLPLFGAASSDERKLSSELYELGLADQPETRIQTILENEPRTAGTELMPLSPLGGVAPSVPSGKTLGSMQPGATQEKTPDTGGAGRGATLNSSLNPANTGSNQIPGEEPRTGSQIQTLGVAPGQVTIPQNRDGVGTPNRKVPNAADFGGQTLGGSYKPTKTVEVPSQPENDDAYYDLMLQMLKKRSAERKETDQAGAAATGQPAAGGLSASTLQPGGKSKPGAEAPSSVVVYTLAGRTNDIFNSYMVAAQEKLKAKRYYEAANNFESAVIVNPSNPLARVGATIAYFAAGEPFTAGYHLQAAFQLFPPLMETKMEALKLVDESMIRERLNQLDYRLYQHPEMLNAILLLTTTYMHANLDQPELAKKYAAMLYQHSGEDKLLNAYANYVLTGKLPKAEQPTTRGAKESQRP